MTSMSDYLLIVTGRWRVRSAGNVLWSYTKTEVHCVCVCVCDVFHVVAPGPMPLQYALCDLTANTRSLVRVTNAFRSVPCWFFLAGRQPFTLCIDTWRLWWSPLLCATGLIHNLSQGTAIYCRKCCPTVSPCGRASGIKETGPIRFQGGCRKRRLNQALSGLCLTPSCSCWVCFVFFLLFRATLIVFGYFTF